MKRCILLAAVACLPLSASAVTLNINAQNLYNTAVGDPMPSGGLVILVASTLDTQFSALTTSSTVTEGISLNPGSDDVVVKEWSLTTPGEFAGSFAGAFGSISGQWGSSDRLRLYWFPTLTTSDTNPSEGTRYGFYPDHDLPDPGASGWVTPSDSDVLALSFLTDNYPGGDNPQSRGVALTVVPEPSFYAGMLAAGCLAWAAIYRRRKS